jgi:hypothetical protein
MLRTVVREVTALAKRREIARMAVAGIVIKMGSCEINPRCSCVAGRGGEGDLERPPTPIAPNPILRIPPPAVTKMADQLPVRPSAMLTAPLGTLEPDHRRQLRPVDRVKPTVLRPDRHQAVPLLRRAAGK